MDAPLQVPDDSVIVSKPGNGPRHLAFHPNGKILYGINELSGTIDVLQYRSDACILLQTISTDSTNKTDKGSADIHVSPDGKHLYATNRGSYNSIATYAINHKTGVLTMLGVQSTLGVTPRNFVIDPTGNFVLVANQKTDNVVVFKRNVASGLLQPTGVEVKVGNPVCLLLVPIQ
jgi:6-phosphogluconolactonase